MFDHVAIGASDCEASRRFYRTVLTTLGLEPTDDPAFVEWGDFSIAQAGGERAVTSGLHIGFAAPSREHVDAFWRAGVDAGYRDDGAPGPRPQYGPTYYGGFLLDPDGNSAEAVSREGQRADGGVDHLWIRVADRAASRRFYDAVAPHAGFATTAEEDDLTRYGRGPRQGSFTLVDGPPTTPFHLAFSAGRATVDAALDPDGHRVEVVRPTR